MPGPRLDGPSYRALGWAVVVVLGACAPEVAGPEARSAPEIRDAAVLSNPHNVLSAVVSVVVEGADSVAVRHGLAADGEDAAALLTPAVRVDGGEAAVPVLGLLPEERYVLRVVAWRGALRSIGPILELRTGSLPADLPRYSAGGTDPSPGYVVFSAGRYGLVIDNAGRVVWYRRFPEGPGLNFMPHGGRYYARPSTLDPTDIEPWIELDALGNIRRAITCANGLQPRFHDLIVRSDDSAWLLCDDTRTLDLTAMGGAAAARVTATHVQHVAADGSLLFDWSPFDHFAIADLDAAQRAGAAVNWTHGNALSFAPDGNLLVSFRNLGEITKIHTETGAVLWRLGGRRNEFDFFDTPTPAFARQHSVRADGPDGLLLLDNVGDVVESRAERYRFDEATRTVRLVQSFRSEAGALTEIGGSVQGLPFGRTLVSYGTAGRVEEYDSDEHVVWSIAGHAGYVFRAERIASLYAPGK